MEFSVGLRLLLILTVNGRVWRRMLTRIKGLGKRAAKNQQPIP
jgi:hypothetical protein